MAGRKLVTPEALAALGAEALAALVAARCEEDWVEALRAAHGRKRAFWNQLEGKA